MTDYITGSTARANYKESYTHYRTKTGNIQLILYRRKKRQSKADRLYFAKQKFSGFILTAIGLITPLIDGVTRQIAGDANGRLFFYRVYH